jgi:hypothetical protein
MSSNQSAPYDLGPNAIMAPAKPEQGQARMTFVKNAFDDAIKIRPSTRVVGFAVIVTSLAASVGGALWAIQLGVSYPIAIMAGYCTLAVSACPIAAVWIFKALGQRSPPIVARPSPSYAAWKLVKKFSVSDASRLWCDIEPGSAVTQESSAWARALLDAISRGELPMIERAGVRRDVADRERNNPNWHTEVTQDALRSWAKSHGYNPRFLHD